MPSNSYAERRPSPSCTTWCVCNKPRIRALFLGLGNSLSPEVRFWLLTVATAVLLLGLTVFLIVQWQMPRFSFIALSCVLAGGLGNMIDRLVHDGRVIDFLNLGLGSLRTGIFNIADIAITGGVVLLWTASLRKAPQPDESAKP